MCWLPHDHMGAGNGHFLSRIWLEDKLSGERTIKNEEARHE
jgi:hypothetical protein